MISVSIIQCFSLPSQDTALLDRDDHPEILCNPYRRAAADTLKRKPMHASQLMNSVEQKVEYDNFEDTYMSLLDQVKLHAKENLSKNVYIDKLYDFS